MISDGDGKPLRGFIPEFYERKTQLWAFVPVPVRKPRGSLQTAFAILNAGKNHSSHWPPLGFTGPVVITSSNVVCMCLCN